MTDVSCSPAKSLITWTSRPLSGGRALRRVLLAIAVTLSVAPLAAALDTDLVPSVPDLAHPFRAVLLPFGPASLEGGVAVPAQQDYAADLVLGSQDTSGEPILTASEAVVTQVEVTWRTFEPPSSYIANPVGAETPRQASIVNLFADARVVSLVPNGLAHVVIVGGDRSQGGFQAEAATCNLWPARYKWTEFEGKIIDPQLARDRVSAECSTHAITATGNQTLFFYNATLVINHRSTRDDGSSDADVVRTGEFSEPDPTLPYVVDHVHRYAIVGSRVTPSVLHHRGEAQLRLNATNVTATGTLGLPRSVATLLWGDYWTYAAHVDPLRPSGVFLVGAPGAGRMELHGSTWNEPPATGPIAPADASASPAYVAAAAAAALPFSLRRVRRLLLGPLLGLFSRVSRSEALDHGRRRAIVDAVAAQPGMQVQDVADLLGLRWSVVHYHVAVLAREGLLVLRRFGRETSLFIPGTADRKRQEQARLLRKPTVQGILRVLAADPCRTQTQVAEELGVRQSHVSATLKELADAGLVRVERVGRTRLYRPLVAPPRDPGSVPAPGPASNPAWPPGAPPPPVSLG